MQTYFWRSQNNRGKALLAVLSDTVSAFPPRIQHSDERQLWVPAPAHRGNLIFP